MSSSEAIAASRLVNAGVSSVQKPAISVKRQPKRSSNMAKVRSVKAVCLGTLGHVHCEERSAHARTPLLVDFQDYSTWNNCSLAELPRCGCMEYRRLNGTTG